MAGDPPFPKESRERSLQDKADRETMRKFYDRAPGGRARMDQLDYNKEEWDLYYAWQSSKTEVERGAETRIRRRKKEAEFRAMGLILREYTHAQTAEGSRKKASQRQARYDKRKKLSETPEEAAARKQRQREKTAAYRARKKLEAKGATA